MANTSNKVPWAPQKPSQPTRPVVLTQIFRSLATQFAAAQPPAQVPPTADPIFGDLHALEPILTFPVSGELANSNSFLFTP